MGVVCCFLFTCVCVSDSSLPSLLAFPYSSYLYGTSNKDTHFKPGPGPQFLGNRHPLLRYWSTSVPGSTRHLPCPVLRPMELWRWR